MGGLLPGSKNKLIGFTEWNDNCGYGGQLKYCSGKLIHETFGGGPSPSAFSGIWPIAVRVRSGCGGGELECRLYTMIFSARSV